jgi:hypothetical protein
MRVARGCSDVRGTFPHTRAPRGGYPPGVQEDGWVLRVTLSDGTEHQLVHRDGVTAKEALEELLHGPPGGWFYTAKMTWVRRDAVIRVTLEEAAEGPHAGASP